MKNRFRILFTFIIFTLLIGLPQKTSILKASTEKTESFNKELIEKNFYILGPGDVLNIRFYELPDISGVYTIMRDGNVQLPLIGSHNLTGYTLDKSIKVLTKLYKEELLNPQIDLILEQPRPIKVSIVGEIVRPGPYTIALDSEVSRVEGSGGNTTTFSGFPSVVDAIQKAGGLTYDADISDITLYRKLPGNNGELKKAKLDLLDLIRNGNQENNPFLFDGDIIEISKINDEVNSIENIPTNLTPEKIRLYVVGEVAAPGMYEVAANTQINQAVLIAGGPNSWRHKDKVELLRVKRNGSIKVEKVAFNSSKLKNKSNKLSLRDGDIIKVNKNIFGKSTDALGTFMLPIRDLYSLYGIYKIID